MQRVKVKEARLESDGSAPDPILSGLAERFQTYYTRIYGYLRYRVDAQEDAEDLVSMVFERAFTRYEQYDESKGAFSTWLFRIARNLLANHYRNHERRAAWQMREEPPPDLQSPDSSPEEYLIVQEEITHLLQGLAGLSERDQEIISLKFAGKLSNREIGEIMEMKEKTVSVALLRAMRRLRKQLDKEAASL